MASVSATVARASSSTSERRAVASSTHEGSCVAQSASRRRARRAIVRLVEPRIATAANLVAQLTSVRRHGQFFHARSSATRRGASLGSARASNQRGGGGGGVIGGPRPTTRARGRGEHAVRRALAVASASAPTAAMPLARIDSGRWLLSTAPSSAGDWLPYQSHNRRGQRKEIARGRKERRTCRIRGPRTWRPTTPAWCRPSASVGRPRRSSPAAERRPPRGLSSAHAGAARRRSRLRASQHKTALRRSASRCRTRESRPRRGAQPSEKETHDGPSCAEAAREERGGGRATRRTSGCATSSERSGSESSSREPVVYQTPESSATDHYKGAHERQRVGDAVLSCGKTDRKKHDALKTRCPQSTNPRGTAHRRRSPLQDGAWCYHALSGRALLFSSAQPQRRARAGRRLAGSVTLPALVLEHADAGAGRRPGRRPYELLLFALAPIARARRRVAHHHAKGRRQHRVPCGRARRLLRPRGVAAHARPRHARPRLCVGRPRRSSLVAGEVRCTETVACA